MIDDLRRLFAARDLLLTWTAREFKVRYSGSLLGVAWAILHPLALLLVLMVVLSVFLRVPTSGVPAAPFLCCGLTPWLFTSGSIQNSAFVLLANLRLVKNVAFPREVLPLGAVIVGLVDLAISGALLAGLVAYYRLPVGWPLLLVPVLIAIQTMLTLAICLFCASWVVFYRDVRFLVPIGLQFWMYLSPVWYPVEAVPVWARPWYRLNPMAALIDGYRQMILFGRWPDVRPLASAAALSAVALVAAFAHFKRAEWEFSDRI